MRQDQIALERPHIGGVDADRSKLAEAGVDAIDRRAAGCDFGDARSCGCNPLMKRCIEPDRRALPIDFFQFSQRNGTGVEDDSHGQAFKMSWWRGLKPMR